MKQAYLVGHISIKDADKWGEYLRSVPSTLEPWEAELVFRGEHRTTLSGQHEHTHSVVIRFADLDTLNGWFHSDAYQGLIPLREQAADIDLMTFEG